MIDVGIIGGGLAGLSLSIQLARKGHSVILFEKETYPFHRVCGEYISMESWSFVEGLGIDLGQHDVPIIRKLIVSTEKGKVLNMELPLGGFGISRYTLDHALAEKAKEAGVIIMEETKVNDVVFDTNAFHVNTTRGNFEVMVACGTYGKRSNIDVRRKRPFTLAAKNKLNNYIGVKYHAELDFPDDLIALYNFHKGYCGIVKVDEGKYNICYLTTADNLQKAGGSINQLESTVLSANPILKKIFTEAKTESIEPVTISQISFDKKSQVEDHMLMIGDAAGMITPLCGNGMSMAMHGSKIAFEVIDAFLQNKTGRSIMEESYVKRWNKEFGVRLKTGRMIQKLFFSGYATGSMIRLIKMVPLVGRFLVKRTHGRSF